MNLEKPFMAAWSLAGVRSVDEGEVSEENIILLNDGSNGGRSTLSESFHDEGALLYLYRGTFKEGGDSASRSQLLQFDMGAFKSTAADRGYEPG